MTLQHVEFEAREAGPPPAASARPLVEWTEPDRAPAIPLPLSRRQVGMLLWCLGAVAALAWSVGTLQPRADHSGGYAVFLEVPPPVAATDSQR